MYMKLICIHAWKVNFISKTFFNAMLVYVSVCKYHHDIKCDISCQIIILKMILVVVYDHDKTLVSHSKSLVKSFSLVNILWLFCFSELIGGSKRLNINYQDGDGWVTVPNESSIQWYKMRDGRDVISVFTITVHLL